MQRVEGGRVVPEAHPPEPGRSRRRGARPKRLMIGGLLGLIVGAVVAVVAAALLFDDHEDRSPLTVEAVGIEVASADLLCPRATLRATATIETRGGSGVIRLQWEQPDGTLSAAKDVAVASEQSAVIDTLVFEISGAQPFVGAVAVHVLEPTASRSVPVEIRYSCPLDG